MTHCTNETPERAFDLAQRAYYSADAQTSGSQELTDKLSRGHFRAGQPIDEWPGRDQGRHTRQSYGCDRQDAAIGEQADWYKGGGGGGDSAGAARKHLTPLADGGEAELYAGRAKRSYYLSLNF